MRVNVYVPDELASTVRRVHPGLNLSAALQRELQRLADCRHDRLVCASCADHIDHRVLIDVALGQFYSDVLWEVGALVVDQRGTPEGALRIVKSIGERYRITLASKLPLPRPSRAARAAAKVPELRPRRSA